MSSKILAVLLCLGGSVFAQGPLTLSDAVATAMKNRPELKAATARFQATSLLTRQAGLLPNPRLIFQSENIRRENFDYGQDADTFLYGSQVIETSGRRGARVEVARSVAQRSELEAQRLRRDIAFDVKQAYWNALAAEQVNRLFHENAGYLQQVVQYHEARLREGKIAEVDVIRVRLEARKLQAAIQNAELDSERARLELARNIGLADLGNATLSENLDQLENPQASSPTSPISSRIEARLATQSVNQARNQLKLERATGRPDLDVLFGYKRTSGLNTALAGLQFNIPIFNRNQYSSAAAKAQVNAAEQDRAATELLLENELRLAIREHEMRRKQVEESFRPLSQQAVEISDVSRAAYKEGGLDLLRLIDAERLRIDSQVSLIRALVDYHTSVANLERAEGIEP